MHHRKTTRPRAPSDFPDPYDATVAGIDFVVHRKSNPHWRISDLVNREYDILAYAVAGKALYHVAEERFEVAGGHLLFFPKGLAHSGQADAAKPWSFFSTAFKLDFSDPRQEAAFAALPHVLAAPNQVESHALFTELERLWAAKRPAYMLRCRSILLQLMHTFVSAAIKPADAAQRSRTLAPILALLHSDVARAYSVGELADMARLSPSRFRVLFKRATGYSLIRYLNWLRVNRAKDLLLSGDCTVGEAARAVGIDDVYYFSRLFKNSTGHRPSYYRNQ